MHTARTNGKWYVYIHLCINFDALHRPAIHKCIIGRLWFISFNFSIGNKTRRLGETSSQHPLQFRSGFMSHETNNTPALSGKPQKRAALEPTTPFVCSVWCAVYTHPGSWRPSMHKGAYERKEKRNPNSTNSRRVCMCVCM